MKKTLVKIDSPIFKVSTNDIKAEIGTNSKSVFNKAMSFFNLTRLDEYVHFYLDENKNNAFEILMTKEECLAFAETYGHERKRTIRNLVAKLEGKFKQTGNCPTFAEYEKKEALNQIKLIQAKMEKLITELNIQLEILNS